MGILQLDLLKLPLRLIKLARFQIGKPQIETRRDKIGVFFQGVLVVNNGPVVVPLIEKRLALGIERFFGMSFATHYQGAQQDHQYSISSHQSSDSDTASIRKTDRKGYKERAHTAPVAFSQKRIHESVAFATFPMHANQQRINTPRQPGPKPEACQENLKQYPFISTYWPLNIQPANEKGDPFVCFYRKAAWREYDLHVHISTVS